MLSVQRSISTTEEKAQNRINEMLFVFSPTLVVAIDC